MGVIVAERPGSDREVVAERSRRQNTDHRKTNGQRGRTWATSVRVTAKSEPHPDTSGRARWRGVKEQVLTRGDLLSESFGEVSRGRSSEEVRRKPGRAKGRSIKQSGLTESHLTRREASGTHGAATAAAIVDWHARTEPEEPGRVSAGGAESSGVSRGERKP